MLPLCLITVNALCLSFFFCLVGIIHLPSFFSYPITVFCSSFVIIIIIFASLFNYFLPNFFRLLLRPHSLQWVFVFVYVCVLLSFSTILLSFVFCFSCGACVCHSAFPPASALLFILSELACWLWLLVIRFLVKTTIMLAVRVMPDAAYNVELDVD